LVVRGKAPGTGDVNGGGLGQHLCTLPLLLLVIDTTVVIYRTI